MADTWTSKLVDDVGVGDHVRLPSGHEFTVARVDNPFMDLADMVCFIEDNPSRWHAYPARCGDAVEVRSAG